MSYSSNQKSGSQPLELNRFSSGFLKKTLSSNPTTYTLKNTSQRIGDSTFHYKSIRKLTQKIYCISSVDDTISLKRVSKVRLTNQFVQHISLALSKRLKNLLYAATILQLIEST